MWGGARKLHYEMVAMSGTMRSTPIFVMCVMGVGHVWPHDNPLRGLSCGVMACHHVTYMHGMPVVAILPFMLQCQAATELWP
jgi:hypothetical protein